MAGDVAANRQLMSSKELPPCNGPKLQAFKHRYASIEWLEWLNDMEGAETPSQGYVFKVRIRSHIYALKVVCSPNAFLIHLGLK